MLDHADRRDRTQCAFHFVEIATAQPAAALSIGQDKGASACCGTTHSSSPSMQLSSSTFCFRVRDNASLMSASARDRITSLNVLSCDWLEAQIDMPPNFAAILAPNANICLLVYQ